MTDTDELVQMLLSAACGKLNCMDAIADLGEAAACCGFILNGYAEADQLLSAHIERFTVQNGMIKGLLARNPQQFAYLLILFPYECAATQR